MERQEIRVARIYLREAEHLLSKIIGHLHDEERIMGLTVLRGIAGFGSDGRMHMASLVDLSLDLPLVVEFYDLPERVEAVVASLKTHYPLPHIVTWAATLHNDA